MQSNESINRTLDNLHPFSSIIQKILDFGNAEDLDQLLQDILDQMVASLNTSYASIMILDENQNQFHIAVTHETLPFPHNLDDILDILKLLKRPKEKGELVVFTELVDESKWKTLKTEEQDKLRKVLCAPFVIHHKTMGVVCIDGVDFYSEKFENETFLLWSGLVSLAIEKYHYLNQENKWQEITGETIKKSQGQLIRSEKLSSLAEIVTSVGHVIRNPITVIGGLCRRMYKELPEDDPKRSRFQMILSEASRLENIVNDFNHYFSIKGISLEYIDINRLVSEAMDYFLDQHHKKQDFVLRRQIWDESLMCRVDPDLFVRSLMHLLANARESNGNDIEITISTSRAGRHAIIDVADTGRGMSQKLMNRVFDPFYTTKGPGAGLGLTFLHFVICEHSGQIELTSEEGVGTRFRIILPLAIPD